MNFRSNRIATLFRLAALFVLATAALSAHAQYNPVYYFGFTDPSQQYPAGQLALGQDGNFYGVINYNQAQIYSITPAGAQTLLWAAPGAPAYGTQCYTGLTAGPDGLLYGTCAYWGGDHYQTGGSGIIFSFDPTTRAFNIIYEFPPCFDGEANEPYWPSALTLGTDGNFYGTTLGNGFCSDDPYGTIFRVSTAGNFKTLYTFQGYQNDDGQFPSLLTLANDGNFYGTTQVGRAIPNNYGTVFRVTSKGKIKYLTTFNNASGTGATPFAGVIQGADGNFYGTTQLGGTNNFGTLFQITKAGKVKYLHSFSYPSEGVASPGNPLSLGSDGKIYGTGNCFSWGCGAESLYNITTKGVFNVVYSGFTDPEGACPNWSTTGCALSSAMTLHPNGTFYGTTQQGGDNGQVIGRGVFYSFSNGQQPHIEMQFPLGKVGSSVGIFGAGFNQASAVSFNGTSASYTVVSDTYLTAIIPAGAKTGYVTVAESAGSLRSISKFTVKK